MPEIMATNPKDGVAGKRGVSDRIAIAAIAVGWIALSVIINPIGEMTLNDDGAYSYAVKSILYSGSFRLSPWGSANLISQAYWGTLFCLPFGFSYTALRVSTLTIALAALLALYGLIREAGIDSTYALFGVLVLALNPLFIQLSFSFMTDVPFLGFALIAIYLLVRGLQHQSRTQVVLGLLVATAALLTRQVGLALFFAFSLTFLLKNKLSIRNVLLSSCPALLGVGVQISYQAWLNATGRMLPRFGQPIKQVLGTSVLSASHLAAYATSGIFDASYVGLFVLPLLLFIGYGRLSDLWRQRKLLAILSSAAWLTAASVVFLRHHRMPFVRNVLYDLGLGPALIRDDFGALPTAGRFFWGGVTVISLVAAGIVVQLLISAVASIIRNHGEHRVLQSMVLATGFIYFVPITLIFEQYDRYYLTLLPLAIVIVLMTCVQDRLESKRWIVLGVLCLLIFGSFAIAGTHDYLAWNRTRWKVLRNLTEVRHIPPDQIDGGFEFDVNYNTREHPWKEGDEFLVSFGPARGYVASESYTYPRWLPPGEGTIFVLRKSPDAPTYSWSPPQSLVRRFLCTASGNAGSKLGINCGN